MKAANVNHWTVADVGAWLVESSDSKSAAAPATTPPVGCGIHDTAWLPLRKDRDDSERAALVGADIFACSNKSAEIFACSNK